MCSVFLRVTFKGRAGIVVTGIVAIAFAVGIVWIANSAVGVLAGLGVPMLAQRRLDQEELQAERDRALALLAELEAARDAQAQAAALEERGRIAREMHDVLATAWPDFPCNCRQFGQSRDAKASAPRCWSRWTGRPSWRARGWTRRRRRSVPCGTPRRSVSTKSRSLIERFPGDAAT